MSNGLFDLGGRVAIVTGTSRGLGQYMALALAKAGADLVLTSRDRQRLDYRLSEVRRGTIETWRELEPTRHSELPGDGVRSSTRLHTL